MQSRYSPGTMIAGRFRLEQPLGEGAYGEVWRATQLPVGRPVAVKLLKPSNDHFARQRFDREARAMAAISHPNCVTFLDFGHLPGNEGSFLVSELVEGEEMRAWMQRRPSLQDMVSVCRQIVAALEAAHRQQVLHRDLKPENVMVRHDPQQGVVAKVLDFGLSKIVDDERRDITKTGEIFGTPGYMSPEQLRGNEIGPATDLYSFGVILYEVLQGRPPFVAGTGHEVCMMHLVDAVPPITTQVPPALAQLAMRLLTKDPRQRPGTAEVSRVLSGLGGDQRPAPPQQFVSHQQPTMQQHPGGFGPPPQAQRHDTVVEPDRPRAQAEPVPPALIGIGVILAVLVAGAIIFALQSDDPPEPQAPTATTAPAVIAAPTPSPDVSAPPNDAQQSDAGAARSVDAARDCLTKPGRYAIENRDGRYARRALLHVPENFDAKARKPVVLLLHESTQGPGAFFSVANFDERADEHGTLLIAPHAETARGPWETPESWKDAWRLVEQAFAETCLDLEGEPDVYVFGYGSGGWAAENLPCHYRVARIATYAHRLTLNEVACATEVPVPHLFMAPLHDDWDPVDGGSSCGEPKMTLAAHQELLHKRHQCRGPEQRTRRVQDGRCFARKCKTPLIECHVEAGRYWPGLFSDISGKWDPCGGGLPSDKFPYDDVLWDFFMED